MVLRGRSLGKPDPRSTRRSAGKMSLSPRAAGSAMAIPVRQSLDFSGEGRFRPS
jgi:hypothetical protein